MNGPDDPAWDDLTPEQKQQLLEMASGNVTRRDLLTGAAALGTGAVVGGGASQAMSEPAAASHNGGTIGTTSNPMEMIHTEGLSSLDSLSTEELSGAHILDPEATDFGAAVESAVVEMSSGETLWVPPVPYDHSTKATVDKQITLKGMGGGWAHDIAAYGGTTMQPVIDKQADVPILETAADTGLKVENLVFESSGVTNTTDFIICHGKTQAKNIVAYTPVDRAGAVILLHQEGTDDNLNNSQFYNIYASNTGPAIQAKNTSGGAININGCMSRGVIGSNCSGWIIDDPVGVGNDWHVQTGTTSSGIGDGAIRFGSIYNIGRCTYLENAEQDGAWVGIQQDDYPNAGIITRGLATPSADFNNVPFSDSAGMMQWRMGRNPMFNFHGPILTSQSGDSANPSVAVGSDSVGLYESGGELYAVNASGTTTQIT